MSYTQYHHHRSPSPREIDDLPEAFHCYAGSSNGSPPGVSSNLPPAQGATSSSTSTSQWHAFSPVVSPSSVPLSLKRSRDQLEQDDLKAVEGATLPRRRAIEGGNTAAAAGIHRDAKGKGRATQTSASEDAEEEDCQMSHGTFQDPASFGLPISLANAAIPGPNPRPYHPQNAEHAHNGGTLPFNGFGVKGTPGGDCKRICVRHQRMVDAGARLDLQKVSTCEGISSSSILIPHIC